MLNLVKWEMQSKGEMVMSKHFAEKQPIGGKQWEAELLIGTRNDGFENIYLSSIIAGSWEGKVPGKKSPRAYWHFTHRAQNIETNGCNKPGPW